MFEKAVPGLLYVMPATVHEAVFVCMFYGQNREALHGEHISYDEWKDILSADNPDEQNFMVYKGAVPVAWFRVNGLCNKDIAWLNMLVVCDKFQREGIGTYAVYYAENFVRERGFSKLSIHMTADNLRAKELYTKCGYSINEGGDTFFKEL